MKTTKDRKAIVQDARSVVDEKTAKQFNGALDRLALARDYALAIENGGRGPQDFGELAGEARKAICKAGEQLERGLCNLGLLEEGTKSGWFVADLRRSA